MRRGSSISRSRYFTISYLHDVIQARIPLHLATMRENFMATMREDSVATMRKDSMATMRKDFMATEMKFDSSVEHRFWDDGKSTIIYTCISRL